LIIEAPSDGIDGINLADMVQVYDYIWYQDSIPKEIFTHHES